MKDKLMTHDEAVKTAANMLVRSLRDVVVKSQTTAERFAEALTILTGEPYKAEPSQDWVVKKGRD